MTAASEPAEFDASSAPGFLECGDGTRLAYRLRPGRAPGLLWLGGFNSDMNGTKATVLDGWAAQWGRACLRFDYFGHGASSGAFLEGTIGRWRDDALAVLDGLIPGPQILVGSSMGGWIALLVALARPERVKGIFLIAPAPDFTEDLIWAKLSEAARAEMVRSGRIERASHYDEAPYPIALSLIEEGRRHLLLRAPVPLSCPVEILHGMADPDVPWQRSLALIERLEAGQAAVTFVKQGDHRLSTPQDLARLKALLEAFVERVAA